VQWSGDLERLRYAIDSTTASDIRIYRIADVDERFHARFSAVRREYRYRVFNGNLAPVLLRGLAWSIRTGIDLNKLNEASERLMGDRDFRTFTGAGQGTGSAALETRRNLDVAEWRRFSEMIEPGGEILEFRVRANAFLPHMVRNLVGSLMSIGVGERPVDWIDELLEVRDRTKALPPAPPDGLVLWSVEYEDDVRTEEKPGHEAGQEQE
jgi:tRNA pseudouridine38-40 synthase